MIDQWFPREVLMIGVVVGRWAAGAGFGAGTAPEGACPGLSFGFLAPVSGPFGRFRAGYRPACPAMIVTARALISRFTDANPTWSRFRFLAIPR